MRRSVVVTGVSSGIGLATARALAARGFRVFGSVRRAADAAPLEDLDEAFTPLVFDVTDPPAVQRAAAAVAEALDGRTLAGLVNNAGIAVAGALERMAIEEFRRQLDVNLVGPLVVTQAFLPLLGTDPSRSGGPGRVVNITSVFGRSALPYVGAYAAAKHGLEGLSESLRRELRVYGIGVVVVAPGIVATPIWDKARALDLRAAVGPVHAEAAQRGLEFLLQGRRSGLPPERVAEVVCEALTAAVPRLRYEPVSSPLRETLLLDILPRRALDQVIAVALGLGLGGRPAARPGHVK